MVHGEQEQNHVLYLAPPEGWTSILVKRTRYT
jgi:hypothetical protein